MPNGNGTFKLLEGADADIRSSYLSLLCGVDEMSIFPSEQLSRRGAGSEHQSWT
jgi:hypothetical protein